jgi:FlaG/FlaF family flagellin (archaellin)
LADIFGDQPVSNTDVTVDILVGEGKKYSDVNALARAYTNADSFIEELKRDNAMLRAQKDANELNKSQGNLEQPTTPQTPAPQAETPIKPADKDLRTLVSEVVQDLSESTRFEQNVETTARRMVEVYGDAAKAQAALQQKARELGVNVEWLRDAAARSPNAFYATMGIPASPSSAQSTPAPKNEMNVIPTPNSGEKSYAYFQNLRKENKSLYYSTEVQAEMQRLAREKGDAFYS